MAQRAQSRSRMLIFISLSGGGLLNSVLWRPSSSACWPATPGPTQFSWAQRGVQRDAADPDTALPAVHDPALRADRAHLRPGGRLPRLDPGRGRGARPVSYTHLTLPTIYSV